MESTDDARIREVRRLVAAHLPGCPAAPIQRLGEGTDHVAYRVADRLLVRFGNHADPAEQAARIEREVRLLRTVGSVSPLPVPVPVFAAAAAGCLACSALPGVPLLSVAPADRAAHAVEIARALGAFLAAMHGLPAAAMRGLVETDHRSPDEWRDEAAATRASLADAIPTVFRPRLDAFLGSPPPSRPFADVPLAFTHNDLGIEHVLVAPATGRVAGIIDWSDAVVADPAVDFARLERDLGPAALDAALTAYRERGAGELDREALAHLRARARFYARCLVLEDLAYGLETGEAAYADKSIAALAWLFPA